MPSVFSTSFVTLITLFLSMLPSVVEAYSLKCAPANIVSFVSVFFTSSGYVGVTTSDGFVVPVSSVPGLLLYSNVALFFVSTIAFLFTFA